MAKPELTLEAMQSTIQSLEDNVTKLHEALEKKGVNSRGTKDIFGRVFSMPVWLFSPTQNTSPSKPTGNGDYLTVVLPVHVQVDAEHKATQFVILNTSNPHSRAFHVSWWGFFSSFFSMFAGAQPPRCRTHPQPPLSALACL